MTDTSFYERSKIGGVAKRWQATTNVMTDVLGGSPRPEAAINFISKLRRFFVFSSFLQPPLALHSWHLRWLIVNAANFTSIILISIHDYSHHFKMYVSSLNIRITFNNLTLVIPLNRTIVDYVINEPIELQYLPMRWIRYLSTNWIRCEMYKYYYHAIITFVNFIANFLDYKINGTTCGILATIIR